MSENTFKITLDHDPNLFFTVNDKSIGDQNSKLVNGSVWRLDGQNYSYDEQINWYVFRRLDNVSSVS